MDANRRLLQAAYVDPTSDWFARNRPRRFYGAPGFGIDVRPHPHIALATVTYLFDGSLEHRDSLGTVREIRPGDVNWMSAGRGIAHSERTPKAARTLGEHVHGIQSRVALPDGQEDGEPTFVHYPASSLPTRAAGDIDLTVIVAESFGLRSPVVTLWPTLYVHARIAHGATRAMLLGGEHFPTVRHIWWNFVASSQERIEPAKDRWERRQFPAVPGESELIPLPHY